LSEDFVNNAALSNHRLTDIIFFSAAVAQLVEQLFRKKRV